MLFSNNIIKASAFDLQPKGTSITADLCTLKYQPNI